jgi:hypothetical protein
VSSLNQYYRRTHRVRRGFWFIRNLGVFGGLGG